MNRRLPGDGSRGVSIPEHPGAIDNITISTRIYHKRKNKKKRGPKWRKVYRVVAHYSIKEGKQE